jgi:hypothetical protein
LLVCLISVGRPLNAQEGPDLENFQSSEVTQLIDPLQEQELQLDSLHTPSAAVEAAWQDISTLPAEERLFQFYVWIRDGDIKKAQTCNFIVNNTVVEMSKPTVVSPLVINDGYLLRYNTLELGPSNPARMHRLLDQLIDPLFYLISPQKINVQIPVQPYKARDGKTYDYKVESRQVTAFGNTVADAYDKAVNLQAMTGRMVPIVSYEYLLHKTQTATNGGMYYKFIEADVPASGSVTQLDAYLKRWSGVSLQEAFKHQTDQRTITTISDITRRERMMVLYQGHLNKPGNNSTRISITFDVADGQVLPEESAIRNLGSLKEPMFKFAGGELIGERTNGGNYYLLFDGDFNFVNEAPQNLAVDRLIPAKHGTNRLEPAISCLRCHAMKEDTDHPEPMGWKHVVADAMNLDISDDPAEILALTGRYEPAFTTTLRRAREDLSTFVVKCTQTPEMSTTQVLNALSEDFSKYAYDYVDASVALYELGIELPANADASQFLQALAIRKQAELVVQDPFIARLLDGRQIRRSTWESICQDVARLITSDDALDFMSQVEKPTELFKTSRIEGENDEFD